MKKKGASREPGRPPSPEAQRRVKFTTKLDKTVLGKLRRLSKKHAMNVNELIEEAVKKHWKLNILILVIAGSTLNSCDRVSQTISLNWTPKNILIFIGGVAVGAVGAYFAGFLSAAGSDSWTWLKKKFNPPEPDDRIVHKDFIPDDVQDAQRHAWILDTNVVDWEPKGYVPYRDSEGRRCTRETRTANGLFVDILLVKRPEDPK